jgi:hypothetical protein
MMRLATIHSQGIATAVHAIKPGTETTSPRLAQTHQAE